MQWTCQLSSKQVLPLTGGVDGPSPGGVTFFRGEFSTRFSTPTGWLDKPMHIHSEAREESDQSQTAFRTIEQNLRYFKFRCRCIIQLGGTYSDAKAATGMYVKCVVQRCSGCTGSRTWSASSYKMNIRHYIAFQPITSWDFVSSTSVTAGTVSSTRVGKNNSVYSLNVLRRNFNLTSVKKLLTKMQYYLWYRGI